MWDLSHGFRDKSWNKAPLTLRRLNWWRKVSGWQLASFSLNLSSLGHKWSPILYHHPRKPLSEPPSPPLRTALICWPTETESNSRRTISTHLRDHPLTPSFPLKSQVLLHSLTPRPLPMQSRLVFTFSFSCLCLLRARIIGVHLSLW